ncbi:MAG TPA: HD domain-containing phosphohydrolase [Dehalococcoidia bacterium]|nr:HD domain-containing phosphohydrolase [Dehalococcoidia bacterium]
MSARLPRTRAGQPWRDLVAGAPIAIVVVEPDGVVTFWNEAAARLTGWAAAEALGRPLPCLQARDLRRLRAWLRASRRSTRSRPFRCTLVRPDNSTVAATILPQRLGEGPNASAALYFVEEPALRSASGDVVPFADRALDGASATRLAETVVRLLTAQDPLRDKLDLVARQLIAITGMEAIDIYWWDPETDRPIARSAAATFDPALVSAWTMEPGGPIMDELRRTCRPVVFEDPAHDPRLSERQRQILAAGGIRSAATIPLTWRGELSGVLSVGSLRPHAFDDAALRLLRTVAEGVVAMFHAERLMDSLRAASRRNAELREQTVMMLASVAEARDQVTGLHLQNIRTVAELLARELGYSRAEAHELGLAAALHDIGKVRVPDLVLSRRGPLTPIERRLIQQHTVWGSELLAGSPDFRLAAMVARHHHERWDGDGYPDGLAGEDIPEAAAIVAVADALDAMTSDRAYRRARSLDEAVTEIAAHAGTQFSPRVVRALLALAARGALQQALQRKRAA